ILVIGRANAGKTTILQHVCNTIDIPVIFDGKGNKVCGYRVSDAYLSCGHHNIEDELVFQSNLGFVFHDSCGFEAGSIEQFEKMKSFVVDQAVMGSLKKHFHAIWFCIPMTDYERTVTAAEWKFFNECDTGHVPVIVLLTKTDALNLPAMEELLDDGLEVEQADEKVAKKKGNCWESGLYTLKGYWMSANFHPKHIYHSRMHEEKADCTTLMQCTADALNEETLQSLLISTQQSSIAICVEYAVQK
ncbi:GTP-binding protein, partial [Pisolithus croceorrhizus]